MTTNAKLSIGIGLLALVALASGCGRDWTRNLPDESEPEKRDATPAPTPAPEPGRGEVFEIRMVGENAGDLTAALVTVSSLEASSQGGSVEVAPVVDQMDLTVPGQAWLLGRVQVSKGVKEVDLAVRFDDAGGYESLHGNGGLDARGAAVSWTAPVESLQYHGHAVIHLDLGQSFIPRASDSQVRVVPQLSVQY